MDKVFASVLLLWVLFLGLRLVAVAFQRIFEGTAGGTRVILQSWHQIDLPFRRLMLFMVGGASLLIVSGTLKPLLWQLEEAVQDQPYTGWSFAGLCLGVTISAFIRWQLFSWPQIGDKSPRVHTLDAIRVGARLAKRQLVARSTMVITIWSLIVFGLLTYQGTSKYPWTASLLEKVNLVKNANEPEAPFLVSAALKDAMHRLESPAGTEDEVAAHAVGLRLLLTIQTDGQVQSLRERASRALSSYQSSAEFLIRKPLETNYNQGYYMAKSLTTTGIANGYLLMGRAYEGGISPNGIDFKLAHEAYLRAAEQGLPEGKKAADELTKRLLASSSSAELGAGIDLLAKEAKDGDPNAQAWMGYIYQVGKNVPVDLKEAQRWYFLASRQKHNKAARERGLQGLQHVALLRSRQNADPIKPVEEKLPKETVQSQLGMNNEITSELSPTPTLSSSPVSLQRDINKERSLQEFKLKEDRSIAAQEAYIEEMKKILSKKWAAVTSFGRTGSRFVVIKFQIDRSGNIDDLHIEKSSGNPYVDDAGRRTVINASLPPFHEDMLEPRLLVHFTFSVTDTD